MKGFFEGNAIENDDLYVLMEINLNDVKTSNAMSYQMLWQYIIKKYEEQPLKYFNETGRLKIIHLKTGVIKTLKLTIDAI